MDRYSIQLFLITIVIASLLVLSSCGTEVDAGPPVPVIESLFASPPTVGPGEKSNINVGVDIDTEPPNRFHYSITILDGGELYYERDGGSVRYWASGAGDELGIIESSIPSLIVEWTAPDEPGEYAFAVKVANAFNEDQFARDTLAITVMN